MVVTDNMLLTDQVERYVEEWRLQPLSRKFARKGSSNACNVAWAD